MAKTPPVRTTAAGPPPKEAVDYLRRKGVRTGYDYREVWREEHARAFTVANMMKVDLLADVQKSITKAIDEGWPADKWKKEMADELAKRGWWGRLPPPDPNDPEAVRKANLYISRRLDTIWRVNTKQAAQAGVWERGMRSTSHPYILYRVGPSKVHREQHLAWDGVLLKKTDPFWAVANPVNGWGCKCYTRFVSQAQYERMRRAGIPQPPQAGKKGRKQVQTSSPELRVETYKNSKTGELHTGFKGIDPGFERNPGIGRMEQLGQQFRRTNRALALAWDVAPGKPTKQHPDVKPVADALDVQLGDRAEARRAESAIAAIGQVHSASALPSTSVAELPAWVTDARGRYIPDLGRIEIGPHLTSGETLAHEIGHLLDRHGLAPADAWASLSSADGGRVARLIEEVRRTPTLRRSEERRRQATEVYRLAGRALRDATARLKAARTKALRAAIQREVDEAQRWYDSAEAWVDWWRDLLSPREIFARAYVQWVAWRSGDQALLDGVDQWLRNSRQHNRVRQWPYAEFLPMVWRFDSLFEAQGWLTRTKIK